MKPLRAIIPVFLLITCVLQNLRAQTLVEVNQEEASTQLLKKMIGNAYFPEITLIYTSDRQALQQICNAIGKKQSLANEAKVIFTIDTPPSHQELTVLPLRQKTGQQVLEQLCSNQGLKLRYNKGVLHFSAEANFPKIKQNYAFLKNTIESRTSITSEEFPQAVRKILTKHNMSFQLYQTPPGKEKKERVNLEPLRISHFRDENSSLLDTLTKLGKSVNLKLIVSKNGVIFISDNNSLLSTIKPIQQK